MEHLTRSNDVLSFAGHPLQTLARQHGTPCYVYHKQGIEQRWLAFDAAFEQQPHLVCYAVKTNSNLAVLQTLARLGAGFDIVSGGELQRALKAGAPASRIVFSGVGKSREEIAQALTAGIKCFNVESEAELYRIEQIAAQLGRIAPISVRVNPDVDPKTHAYISTGLKENKFGVSFSTAERLYLYAERSNHLAVTGIDCHIGSQLLDLAPLQEAARRVVAFQQRMAQQGIHFHHIDMGGGLGINYRDTDNAPSPQAYVQALREAINQPETELLIEPGRSIVGNNGLLLTTIELIKENEGKHFVVTDAAMNDLIRPALYGAWQDIVPVVNMPNPQPFAADVVGPVCETGDFLGKDRQLAVDAGDVLAVLSAGAYGFVMSSNYNSRPRAAELLIDGDQVHVVRRRETFDDLIRGEALLP